MKMADKLTIKQEKYVQGLFAGLSQREAYKQAYNCKKMKDKTIDENASRLANDSKVKARLRELTEELKQRNMVTVEKVLAELAKVGFANGSDFARVIEKEYTEEIMDDEGNKTEKIHKYKVVDVIPTELLEKDKLAAIAGIKATDKGIEIKTNDKLKALELMGKYLGMFTDKVEMTGKDGGPIDIRSMTEEELDQQIKEMQERIK
jgi:phage terminase small subunit